MVLKQNDYVDQVSICFPKRSTAFVLKDLWDLLENRPYVVGVVCRTGYCVVCCVAPNNRLHSDMSYIL